MLATNDMDNFLFLGLKIQKIRSLRLNLINSSFVAEHNTCRLKFEPPKLKNKEGLESVIQI